MADRRFALLSDEPALADGAATLLATQWPATKKMSRLSALQTHCRAAKPGVLPCHLLLLIDDKVCGHCRLQPACENADGFSAAVTSVVVDQTRRGQGLGRALLRKAEEFAASLGFGYIYLWTHDAQPFYVATGYTECEKVALLRPSLISLGSAAVGKLEALIAKKAMAGAGGDDAGGGGGGGGAGGADEACVRADSTWFKKRVRELAEATPLSLEALEASVREALAQENSDGKSNDAKLSAWSVRLRAVAWERQIGPCCGLAAIRMARSVLRATAGAPETGGVASLSLAAEAEVAEGSAAAVDVSVASDGGSGATSGAWSGAEWAAHLGGELEMSVSAAPDASADASVLHAAIERGYSADGEVFDAHHLALLAAEVCGLEASVVLLDAAGSGTAGSDTACTNGGLGRCGALGAAPAASAAAAATEPMAPPRPLWLGRGLAGWLASGGVAIIPYDADATHLPALKGGLSAHYALVCGVATRSRATDEDVGAKEQVADDGEEEEQGMRLVCLHGLSRRPLVVSSAALSASNAQLHAMKATTNTRKWVVGAAGIRLSRRVVLLR